MNTLIQIRSSLLILLFIIIAFNTNAQRHRIMFYNVENLFDTENDSLTNDDEFMPNGSRYWNKSRYYKKVNRIFQVAAAVGEWQKVSFIGLCEIENRKTLNKLIYNTPLSALEMSAVHKESPDRRGIDVALLYRKEIAKLLYSEFIKVDLPTEMFFTTRDILYAKFLVEKTDTIHMFVNHWPSRRGGEMKSRYKRVRAASILRSKTDSIFSVNSGSKIVIMGDFNDEPSDVSLSETLNTKIPDYIFSDTTLYNLSVKQNGLGTHKYRGVWSILDQIIVSGSLLNADKGYKVSKLGFNIFSYNYLLEKDERYTGTKPKSTYSGYRYNDGFSDHLPVFIDLYIKQDRSQAP